MEDDGSVIPQALREEERIKRNLSEGEKVLFLLEGLKKSLSVHSL